jgi:hypothetical protein
VSIEDQQQHVAMPKLYGAPAYARPPAAAVGGIRPFDPDEMPLEAERTDQEREFASRLPARAYRPGGVALGRSGGSEVDAGTHLRPRSFSLRAIAGKLLGGG